MLTRQRFERVAVGEVRRLGPAFAVHDRLHPAGREGVDEQVDREADHAVVAAEPLGQQPRGPGLVMLADAHPVVQRVLRVEPHVVETCRSVHRGWRRATSVDSSASGQPCRGDRRRRIRSTGSSPSAPNSPQP